MAVMKRKQRTSSNAHRASQQCYLAAIIMMLIHCAASQTICPQSSSSCSIAGNDQQYVYEMKCFNFGLVDELPAACPDTRIVNKLTVEPETSTILSLPALALDGLRVISLTLSDLGIERVDKLAFNWLSDSLQELKLDGNQLTTLPDGVFSSLSSLVLLQLQNNRLTMISAHLFDGLPSLKSLDLSGNRINMLELDAWKPMPLLATLQLNDNHLSGTLNSSILGNLNQLETLRLDGNRVTELAPETFDGLTKLLILNVAHNRIGLLPDSVFAGNRLLKSVDASFNEIVGLSANVFNETKSLTSVSLNNNRISHLPIYIFQHMYNLRSLYLQNNEIDKLLSNSLSGLSSARHLDLSANRISQIPLGIFDPLGFVESLSLADNRIAVVERAPFASMRNIDSLDFSRNFLKSISAEWFATTPLLTKLRLDGNRLEEIEIGAFADVPNLQEIHLDHNRMSSIEGGLFENCSSLRNLDLSFNPLRRVVDEGTAFAGLSSLQRLNLSTTCLTELSFGANSSLTGLKELDISSNTVKNLTALTFAGVPALRRLLLASNDIDDIDNSTFSSLHNLELLDLSANALESNSRLTSVLSTLLSSVVVDLSWNLLRNVDALPELFGGVFLHGNPLACDCNSTSWLTSNHTKLLDRTVTACLHLETGRPEVLTCYWAMCSIVLTQNDTLSMSGECATPLNSLSYLTAASRRAAVVCPWDVAPPAVLHFNVEPFSPTSVFINWNLTAGSDVIITVTHISSYSTNNSLEVEMDMTSNVTNVVVANMTAGASYNVCMTTIFKARLVCVTVILPAEPTPSPPPVVLLRMSATFDESNLYVAWRVATTTSDIPEITSFRLTWTENGTSGDISTVWMDSMNTSYTISGLSQETVYQVCVTAFGEEKRTANNATECDVFETRSKIADNTTLIIIIAASAAGAFLLLLIVVIIIACCCWRKRHQNKADDETVKARNVVMQADSTRSVNRGSLPQHSVVSVSVYEDVQS